MTVETGWRNWEGWKHSFPSWEGWKAGDIVLPELPGLCLHLDGSCIPSIGHDDGYVTVLGDLSGLLNHVTQPVAANQAQTGLDQVNGRNVLTFAGGNAAVGSWMKKVGFSNPDIQEFFFVISIADHTGNAGLLGDDGDNENIRFDPSNSRQCRYNNDTVIPGAPGDNNDFGAGDGLWNPEDRTGSVVADLILPLSTPTRVHCTRGNNATQLFNSFVLGGDKAGGGRYLKMKFCELVATDQVQEDKTRWKIRDYLSEKWDAA